MADLLKAWLRARLGVIMDLTPETFGRYTRDGTLLAQILHNYDIISSNQLSTIVRTYDPALCRVNLKTLRIWLKLINVALSDECIEEISKGKGAAALELFYKVYLSLEGKDRLHFIALQKEREKLVPTSGRFGVTRVYEDPPPYQPPEHPLSKPLIESADTILWYRNKFWSIVQACKSERRRFEAEMKYPTVVEPVEYFVPSDIVDEAREESERLDEFAHEHPARKSKQRKKQLVECCPQKKFLDLSSVEDPATAREYVDLLRKRGERTAKFQDSKLKIQTTMMADTWEKLLRQQDKSFDEVLGLRVLDQSRYEKQIMRKLCEVRDVRNRVVENRRIVDTMLLKIRESEQRLQEHRELETTTAEARDVEMEHCRMRELRRRIREEKLRRFGEMHRGICAEVARDLADIAVKIAEYRQANDDQVPRSVWSDCRTLFLKNQPIFEFVDWPDFFEVENEEEDVNIQKNAGNTVTKSHKVRIQNGEDAKNEEERTESRKERGKVEDKQKLELLQLELDRQRVFADADFENYRDFTSPWDEFVPTKKEGQEEDNEAEEIFRLGRVVLDHVVHRLLGMLYKRPTETVTPSIPKVKVAAIVFGITSAASLEELRELLKMRDVHLLRMEDAINHCLEWYKREMADVEYIDLDVISATTRSVGLGSQAEDKTNGRKDRRVKLPGRRMAKDTAVTQQEDAVIEKQTQTPRQIPYDDLHPILSDVAYIGKRTYEFLTLGQPIPNELNTKILAEYFKGIGNVEGWALINYPNTYEQMAMLEEALTGYQVPPDRNKVLELADVNVEDIDPPSPRIPFDANEVDTFAICRQSRLLPDPISNEKDRPSFPTTFVTIYIKALLKPKASGSQTESCVPLPDDATSIDEYYADRNIAYGFYYNVLDLSTIKQLAEFITGDRLIEKRSSLGPLEEVPGKQKQEPFIDPKAATIKRWVPKSKWQKLQHDEEKDSEIVSRDLPAETKTQLTGLPARPGENGWQWMDLPQSPLLLETLATLWESMEEGYVENLKEIFSLKRIHTSAIIPYKESVLRNLTKFIDRPDNRQNLLQDFHRAFNEIDEDLRDDVDMKCELHCRVVDFRAELWELCDTRRHEAEEERKRILRNHWIPLEAVVLVNVYIEILQTEIDRFVDTVQLLQDYYTSMSQKPLQESQLSKILLDRVELKHGLRETSNSDTIDGPIDDKEKKTATKTKADFKSFARTANIEQFKMDIESLLIDESTTIDPEQNTVYDVIKDTIRQVRSVVDSISSTITEMLKKEEKAAALNVESKDKGTESVSSNSTLTKLARRRRDLVEEWRYAVQFEIDRIRRYLDVLDAAARSDVAFLLDTMRRAFHRLHDYIVERYKREIESVNDMAGVFRFAVEEAKPIQQEMLLDGDRFVMRSNVLMFPDEPELLTDLVQEIPVPLRFRVIQVARLLDIFRRVAPHGIISERALVYILQDLVSCGEEDCYPAAVPCAWRQLRAPDIEILVERLFGACEYIEWREFIVYAMDLPVPSYQDILIAQAAFRRQDPELREVISRDQYRLTPLWFLENVETSADVFHEYLYGDHETLLDEEGNCNDYEKIMDTMLREAARLGARIAIDSGLKRDLIETDEDKSSDTLRLILAKELLGHTFSVDRDTVNYTAMLLAFCKDEDPREGLGKAFTLAIGNRVCIDTAEGERYAQELVKHRAKHLGLTHLPNEATEIARDIMNCIINRVAKGVAILENRRFHEQNFLAKRRMMIQQLNGNGEIDPATLVPAKVTPEHLMMENLSTTSDEHEYGSSFVSDQTLVQEGHEIQWNERVIYWLSRDVCLTVLAACLPWHASQADLFHTSLSLREGITRVYDELMDAELNDESDVVLAHRLINHRFILQLLSSSNKFVSKNVSALTREILENRYNEF